MHAKYQMSISIGSEVIANDKVGDLTFDLEG